MSEPQISMTVDSTWGGPQGTGLGGRPLTEKFD